MRRGAENGFAATVEREAEERRREEKRRERAARLTGAHTTMPIRDKAMRDRFLQIARAHDARRTRGGVSWYLLVMLGFNTALRIGDLCQLRVKDIRGRERVRVTADKTGKMTNVKLSEGARKMIDRALQGADGESWVLKSRQRSASTGEDKPVSRQRCYAILKEIAAEAGFREHVGCHTMRKTFAWNFYQSCGSMAKLQKVLNHSSQEATIHYLGLDQDAIDEVIDSMEPMV